VKRQSYDGVVLAAPVSVPYVRYSQETAHWWIARALKQTLDLAGLSPRELDGFSVSSFTLFPDTPVGLTQHLGLSPRWLDSIPMGGACGVVALRRAARAVQAVMCRGCLHRRRRQPDRQFPAVVVVFLALCHGCLQSLRIRAGRTPVSR
jgi:hypothetical protein